MPVRLVHVCHYNKPCEHKEIKKFGNTILKLCEWTGKCNQKETLPFTQTIHPLKKASR